MASVQEPKIACLCHIAGFDSIRQQQSGEKLQEKWPSQPQTKKKTKAEKKKAAEIGRLRGKIECQYGTNAVFTTGPNGTTCTSVDELTQYLLERDCEKLFKFDGKKSAGATIVPEIYVPMKPSISNLKGKQNYLKIVQMKEKTHLLENFIQLKQI